MQRMIEAVMRVPRRVVVGMRFLLTLLAPEQVPPLYEDALSALEEEPLPPRAASGAILRRAMRVNFHRDHGAAGIRLRARILPDLAAQLVGLAAIHAPGLRSALRLELAQPLEEEDAAGVLRTDGRDLTGDRCRAASSLVRLTCRQRS